MATMIPSSIEHLPEKHDAEKRAFASLKALPAHYQVYHSVSFAKNCIDYECDFVVVHEQKGFLCLEVKGGHITSSGGAWTSENKKGIHRIKNPVEQAKNAMLTISSLFTKRYNREFPGIFGRGIVFPDCAASLDTTFIQIERSSILDTSDLLNAAQRIEAIFDEYARIHPQRRLLPQDHRDLTELLSGDLSLPFSIKRGILERENRLKFADHLQEYTLDLFDDKKRIAFQGSAGTGKTYLAMKKAKRLCAANKRVLFLCYNKRLAAMIGENLGEEERITVMTFSSFASALIRRALADALNDAAQASSIGSFAAGLYLIGHEASDEAREQTSRTPEQRAQGYLSLCMGVGSAEQPRTAAVDELLVKHKETMPQHLHDLFSYLLSSGDPWRERIPLALIHLMEGNLIPESLFVYDALLIDEGQDFEKSWCDCLALIFNSYRSRTVYLFYDDNQNIFTRLKELPVNALISKSGLGDHVFKLTDNLRNTRQIHEFAVARSSRGSTAKALDVDGMDPVQFKAANPAAAATHLASILRELDLTHRIDLHDITVLSNRSLEHTPFASKKAGDYTLVAGGDAKHKMSVKFRTIHEFKGLEADIVILFIQNTKEERENAERYLADEVLYVACTRAKSLLYVVELEG